MNSLNRVPWFLTLVVVATIVLLIGCEDEERSSSGSTTIVTGVWLDVAGDNSTTTVTLVQSDNAVTGMFFDQNGWTGTVAGDVDRSGVSLTYTYSDGYIVYNRATVNGNQMTGTFESADGKRYGTWSARRIDSALPDIGDTNVSAHEAQEHSEQERTTDNVRPIIEEEGIEQIVSTIKYKQLNQPLFPLGWDGGGIDLNDDNITDLLAGWQMLITMDVPTSGGEAFFQIRGGQFILGPLPAGMMIDSNPPQPYVWQTAGYGVNLTTRRYQFLLEPPQASPWEGPWAYVTNGYLAVQMSVSGSVYYGWVRMSAPADSGQFALQMTFHDCAYESVPGKGILAGATE